MPNELYVYIYIYVYLSFNNENIYIKYNHMLSNRNYTYIKII